MLVSLELHKAAMGMVFQDREKRHAASWSCGILQTLHARISNLSQNSPSSYHIHAPNNNLGQQWSMYMLMFGTNSHRLLAIAIKHMDNVIRLQ